MTANEIIIPLMALAMAGAGILCVRWLNYRLDRDEPKTPPAE